MCPPPGAIDVTPLWPANRSFSIGLGLDYTGAIFLVIAKNTRLTAPSDAKALQDK